MSIIKVDYGSVGGGGLTTIENITSFNTPNTFNYSVPSGVKQIVMVISSYYAGTNVSITGGTIVDEKYVQIATTGAAPLHCLIITPTSSTVTANITSQDAYARSGYITVIH